MIEIVKEGAGLLGKVLDIVSKAIPDKDKARETALEVFQLVQGRNAQYWLPANAFSIAMLANVGVVVYLTVVGEMVPQPLLIVMLAWLAGPLLNTLSRDTLKTLFDMAETFAEWQRERKNKKQQQEGKI